MGGPGSGGYKTAPGDVETHSAWEIIVQDPDSSQVSHTVESVASETDTDRNSRKYDASSVAERWRSTLRGRECTCSDARTISWR
jgi:hypothetical protein